jgi:hypothetical protein
VIDTLVNAKEMHPGKRNSLDALCDRYGVSNAHRKLHGALLDSELLADVYLSMTRGQNSLSMDHEAESTSDGVLLDAVPLGEIIVVAASRGRTGAPRRSARRGSTRRQREVRVEKLFAKSLTVEKVFGIIRLVVREVSSGVEHCIHTAGVASSKLALPTRIAERQFASRAAEDRRLPDCLAHAAIAETCVRCGRSGMPGHLVHCIQQIHCARQFDQAEHEGKKDRDQQRKFDGRDATFRPQAA